MDGFQPSVQDHFGRVTQHKIILMDGGDLTAILEKYVSLDDLLRRNNTYAVQTGNIFLSAWTVLSE